MENLISLVDLISRQKLHQIDVVDELEDEKNKLSILYNGISNGNIKSDKDAALLLYGSDSGEEKLKKLKYRLNNKLLNSIFFIDQTISLYNDPMTAARNCYKNYAAIRLLIGNRKRDVAIDLALKTFKISKKYEFTDLNYLLSALLSNNYLTHSLKKKKYLIFKKHKNYYQTALMAENDIREMQGIFDMSLSLSSSGLSDEEILMHSENLVKINETQKTVKTYRYNLFAYLYQINLYLEIRAYDKISELIDEAMVFFKEKGVDSVDVIILLKLRSGVAHFMMKNYSKAEYDYFKIIEFSVEYSINWYSAYNSLISLSVNQFLYASSYDLMSIIMNSPKFEKTHPLLVQQFKIKEAYIHFLIGLGKIDPEKSEEKPLRKFRLNRFLNDVPTYSKDKRGVNISILIIQMLLLVQSKKHGEILDKLDALNMYSHRYLRSDNTFRSNCFIKMLAKLPDADYHPVRWERYVKKFRDRLDEHPFELSYHNLDLEVIPFETLYDLLLEMLEKQRK